MLVDVYVVGCPPRPEALFYALLKLQDKIDHMTLAKRPTEVRLQPQRVEEFKKNVMVAQWPSRAEGRSANSRNREARRGRRQTRRVRKFKSKQPKR